MLALLFACVGDPADEPAPDDSAVATVEWTHARAPLAGASASGRAWRRGIIHLHSPFSHDACDNQTMDPTQCLADFRAGLCASAVDFAFVTDHPAFAADQTYEDLFWSQEGDEIVDGLANRIPCDGGHTLLTMPGIEDELMPIGLDHQAAETPEDNDAIYNGSDQATFSAEIAAGATVLQAHTEERDISLLRERQAMGLAGTELFNLHAMVDPDNRVFLGLDPYSYLETAGAFIGGETDAEPDLVFLAFYEEQAISVERWDQLNQTGFAVGTAGTDAHENALPMAMSDGERVDSYRRMTSWFSNVLLVDGDSPEDYQAAVAAGRLFVAFEALGVPAGFDVSYGALEMGGEADVGDVLDVSCPTLAPTSPTDGSEPEIAVVVLKDGEPWADGCGEFPVTEPGVYRVRVDIVPHHLAGFLLEQSEAFVHDYPWLYSNSFRIGL
jgi:hypothetical protein